MKNKPRSSNYFSPMNPRRCQTEDDASVKNFFLDRFNISGISQGAGGLGGLLSVSLQGTNAFVAFDGNGYLGGLVKTTDGTVAGSYEYGPFGEVIRSTGPMATANHFRFSTKYQDDESDLLHYGYRYYKASTGTWVNRDPIEEKGGLDLYEFVHNSPVNLVDPEGLRFGDGKICRNYCGGGYCGGKHLKPGEKCDYSVPATDALDACCKAHDQCYDDVDAGKTTKAKCDATLCTCSKAAKKGPHDTFGCIAWKTVPIWACYLTGR